MNSIIDDLRDQRSKRVKDRDPLEMPVPGWQGKLVMKLRLLDWDELKRLTERADKMKGPRIELAIHADSLILACEGLYYREGPGAELVPVPLPGREDEAARFEPALVAALGGPDDLAKARDILLWLFDNDVAVSQSYAEYAEWLGESTKGVDEDMMGES